MLSCRSRRLNYTGGGPSGGIPSSCNLSQGKDFLIVTLLGNNGIRTHVFLTFEAAETVMLSPTWPRAMRSWACWYASRKHFSGDLIVAIPFVLISTQMARQRITPKKSDSILDGRMDGRLRVQRWRFRKVPPWRNVHRPKPRRIVIGISEAQ